MAEIVGGILLRGCKELHAGFGAGFAGDWHVWCRSLFRREWVSPGVRVGKRERRNRPG